MWTVIYLELLIFLDFVSPTVIPAYRKLTDRQGLTSTDINDNPIRPRIRRDPSYISELMNENEFLDQTQRVFHRKVCDSFEATSPLISDEPNLVVSGSYSSPTTDYRRYVRTSRCMHENQVVVVGGVNVKCVQMYLTEILAVYDATTGQKIRDMEVFHPAGCEARMESP